MSSVQFSPANRPACSAVQTEETQGRSQSSQEAPLLMPRSSVDFSFRHINPVSGVTPELNLFDDTYWLD